MDFQIVKFGDMFVSHHSMKLGTYPFFMVLLQHVFGFQKSNFIKQNWNERVLDEKKKQQDKQNYIATPY